MTAFARFTFLSVLCASLSLPDALAQLTPQQAAQIMGRGINLGNTLEPPTEGGWNNGPAQEYYFDDYVDAGFRNVRIPIRWDNHTSQVSPYAVNSSWMDRVEQIVNWALERDLVVIINAHHEDWLKQSYTNQASRDRFDSIWRQIAERFKDHSDQLLFEIINEPFGMTRLQVDDLNARILGIIRETNPTRIVVYSGNEWSGLSQMKAAAIPDSADEYLMAYYHSYDPWGFAGEGNGEWGTESDWAEADARFRDAATWSTNTGIPVMLSEFGTIHDIDYNSSMRFFAAYVECSLDHGVLTQVWDDGGWFKVYERDSRTWDDRKDVLIHTYLDSPTRLTAEAQGDTLVTLNWRNRTTQAAGIDVQRALPGGAFETITTLPASADSYSDENVTSGDLYRYRVIARNALLGDRHSYPQEVRLRPTSQSYFYDQPLGVPGTVEAEDFDRGGEGLSYHDSDDDNIPGGYRPLEGVDLEPRNSGGFQIAYVETGEWVEYTLYIATEGLYDITSHVASQDGGGQFLLQSGGKRARVMVPRTGDWQTTVPVSSTLELKAGEQELRLSISSLPPFNIDRMEFSLVQATSAEHPQGSPSIDLYPNPVSDWLRLVHAGELSGAELTLYDVLGRSVDRASVDAGPQNLDVSRLAQGAYFVRITRDGQVLEQRAILKN